MGNTHKVVGVHATDKQLWGENTCVIPTTKHGARDGTTMGKQLKTA